MCGVQVITMGTACKVDALPLNIYAYCPEFDFANEIWKWAVKMAAAIAEVGIQSSVTAAGELQVIAHLEPLQQRYSAIMDDQGYLDSVLSQGAGESYCSFSKHCYP